MLGSLSSCLGLFWACAFSLSISRIGTCSIRNQAPSESFSYCSTSMLVIQVSISYLLTLWPPARNHYQSISRLVITLTAGHLPFPAGECPCGCRRFQLQPFAFQPTCRTSGSSFKSPAVQRIDPGSTFRRIKRSGHNPTTCSKAWGPSGPSTIAGANWNLDSWSVHDKKS